MDIKNIIRTKAAVYAACSVLLKNMEFTFGDIKRIYIAGGFDYYRFRQLSDLSLFEKDERIKFLGRVSDEDLKNLYKNALLFVFPSLYEGFGIAYIEALGFGLPIIATTKGAAKEIIKHGNQGFLINPNDYNSLKQYISILIHDHELLYQMSVNSLQHYKTFPTWKESMNKIIDYLKII